LEIVSADASFRLYFRFVYQGLIGAQHFTGQWTDVGTSQRLTELNKTDS